MENDEKISENIEDTETLSDGSGSQTSQSPDNPASDRSQAEGPQGLSTPGAPLSRENILTLLKQGRTLPEIAAENATSLELLQNALKEDQTETTVAEVTADTERLNFDNKVLQTAKIMESRIANMTEAQAEDPVRAKAIKMYIESLAKIRSDIIFSPKPITEEKVDEMEGLIDLAASIGRGK